MVKENQELERPRYLDDFEDREVRRLVEEDIQAEEESRKLVNRVKEAFKYILTSKWALLVTAIVLSVGLILYVFLKQEEVLLDKGNIIAPTVDQEKSLSSKPVVYELKPFFLPLLINGKETGKFISVKAHLLLSNKIVAKEVDQALLLIRQSIYKILQRKKESDFLESKRNIEERIKKEILISANTNLVSGIGTIDDVFFSEFIIK